MTQILYASDYAMLDSNVLTGGGTDDTAALQALLDQAEESGGLRLIMDGAALVTGLRVYPNTTIECLDTSCGFFLRDGSNDAILKNAHWDLEEIRDNNITLIGGTYNHNCRGQQHDVEIPPEYRRFPCFSDRYWVMGFVFFGVQNLIMRDVTIRNQTTFALLAANWEDVWMENIRIELPDHQDCQNQDGLHFWGPGRNLTLRGISGESGDDFIALAPDEHDFVSNITDVLIDCVTLKGADQGIRLLSCGTGRLDRVLIRNVTGTYKSFGFIINPWVESNGGNYGNIVFDGINLNPLTPNYTYMEPFLFKLGGNIDSLVLKNIYHIQPEQSHRILEAGLPYDGSRRTGDSTRINSLLIDGLHILDNSETQKETDYIYLDCPAKQVVIRNTEVLGRKGSCLVKTGPDAVIDTLVLSQISAQNLEAILSDENGTVHLLRENAVTNDVFSE